MVHLRWRYNHLPALPRTNYSYLIQQQYHQDTSRAEPLPIFQLHRLRNTQLVEHVEVYGILLDSCTSRPQSHGWSLVVVITLRFGAE
jgi:hypothetical protein